MDNRIKRNCKSVIAVSILRFSSLIKSIVYGFTIGIVGCYQGFHASNGTEGVGKSANSSVVLSMFLIFIEEILIVEITNSYRV